MRRLISIAAFSLFLAVPLWAQHGGGGHGGGGSHGGGFSGGHAGFSGSHAGFSGGHASGMRSAPGASHGFTHTPSFSGRNFSQRGFSVRGFSQRSSSRRPFLHDEFRGDRFRQGFRDNDRFRFRTYGFRNNCYGYGCWGGFGYGYPWWGYNDPFWWDSDSSYDQDSANDRAQANEMNQESLEEQQMRRQEEADGDQDVYARSAPRSAPGTGEEQKGAALMPSTVLVYRDQHKQEIQNYAIVGQTLWNFAPQRTEKIPLAELDLTATTKANDDRGVTFRVPATGEGQ